MVDSELPLHFDKHQWLKINGKSPHSQSELQVQIINYLRTASEYLQSLCGPTSVKTISAYITTLRSITNLAICSSSAVRIALSDLWVQYLDLVDGNLLVSSAAWLSTEFRDTSIASLKNPQLSENALILATCVRNVFVKHFRTLIPLALELSSTCITILSSHGILLAQDSRNLVLEASSMLMSFTGESVVFLGKLKQDLVSKVALPLFSAEDALLYEKGAAILSHLIMADYTQATPLGTKRGLKRRAEIRIYNHECQKLVVSLIVRPKNRKQKQIVDSITRVCARISGFASNETVYEFLLTAFKMCGKIIQIALLDALLGDCLVSDNPITSVVVAMNKTEYKPKTWCISPSVLHRLISTLNSHLFMIIDSDFLTSNKHEKNYPVIAQWHINDVMKRESECLSNVDFHFNLLQEYDSDPFLRFYSAQSLNIRLQSQDNLRIRFIESKFAHLKMSISSLVSGGSKEGLMNKIYSLSIQLAILIPSLDRERSLYFSQNIFEQIGAFAASKILQSSRDLELVKIILSASIDTIQFTIPPKITFSNDELVTILPMIHLRLSIGNLNFAIIDDLLTRISFMCNEFCQINTIKSTFILNSYVNCVIMRIKLQNFEESVFGNESESILSSETKYSFCCGICNIICELDPNFDSDAADLLLSANHVLSLLFSSLSDSNKKSLLSQMNIYNKNSKITPSVLACLEKVLETKESESLLYSTGTLTDSKPDQFFVEVIKQIIFPAVCHSFVGAQKSAARCLGQLVRIINSKQFASSILNELIDRALNETSGAHRRGYIFAIATVYILASNTSVDKDATFETIFGLFSSLAKDSRCEIVQTAAIYSLSEILVHSEAIVGLYLNDVAILTWQIYSGSASSNTVINSVTNLCRSVTFLMGPTLSERNHPSSQCLFALVKELLKLRQLNSSSCINILDTYVQIMLVVQNSIAESDLLSFMSDHISENLIQKNHCYPTAASSNFFFNPLHLNSYQLPTDPKAFIKKSIECLYIFLKFVNSSMHPKLMSLVPHLLAVYDNYILDDETELDSCLSDILKLTFDSNINGWLRLFLTRSATSVPGRPNSSQTQLNNELFTGNETLLKNPRNSTESLASSSSPPNSTEISARSLEKLIVHFIEFMKNCGSNCWSQDIILTFVPELVRLAMSFFVENQSISLRLVGIQLSCQVISSFGLIQDSEGFLLDTFQSQIMAIFSRASTDNDFFIVASGLGGLFETISSLFGNSDISVASSGRLPAFVVLAKEIVSSETIRDQRLDPAMKSFVDLRIYSGLASLAMVENCLLHEDSIPSPLATKMGIFVSEFALQYSKFEYYPEYSRDLAIIVRGILKLGGEVPWSKNLLLHFTGSLCENNDPCEQSILAINDCSKLISEGQKPSIEIFFKKTVSWSVSHISSRPSHACQIAQAIFTAMTEPILSTDFCCQTITFFLGQLIFGTQTSDTHYQLLSNIVETAQRYNIFYEFWPLIARFIICLCESSTLELNLEIFSLALSSLWKNAQSSRIPGSLARSKQIKTDLIEILERLDDIVRLRIYAKMLVSPELSNLDQSDELVGHLCTLLDNTLESNLQESIKIWQMILMNLQSHACQLIGKKCLPGVIEKAKSSLNYSEHNFHALGLLPHRKLSLICPLSTHFLIDLLTMTRAYLI